MCIRDRYKALVDLYGKAAVDENMPEVNSTTGDITDGGFFKFDSKKSAVAKFTGLDTAAIADQVAADAADTDKHWASNGQTQTVDSKPITIAELKKHDVADFTALFNETKGAAAAGTPAGMANKVTDWVAIEKLIGERYTEFAKNAKDSKEMLIDAVRAYYTVGDDNATARDSKGGALRIGGADRYETSAKLSIFQSKDDAGKPGAVTGESRMKDMVAQFLASGNNANLIDSVFLGQMRGGTILLVPTEGELNALTKIELQRKGTSKALAGIKTMPEGIFASQLFVAGGKAAVSDDVFIAAVNAMAGI